MYLIDNKLPSLQLNENKISLPSINKLNLPLNLPLPTLNIYQQPSSQAPQQQQSPPPSQLSQVHPPAPVQSILQYNLFTSSSENSIASYNISPISPISPTFKNEQSPQIKSQTPSDSDEPFKKEDHSQSQQTLEKKDKWKPRRKRQCPDCKLYFSNLATHKSTHLNPNSRPHICKYCSRGFARPNDLFRHIKCHWKEIGVDKGQFKCPYKDHSTGDHCGHNSGIFSRCDTFKNHLKAIHFQYPNGTRKDQRFKSPGVCRMCQLEFNSVDDWLANHVEKNQCKFANEMKK